MKGTKLGILTLFVLQNLAIGQNKTDDQPSTLVTSQFAEIGPSLVQAERTNAISRVEMDSVTSIVLNPLLQLQGQVSGFLVSRRDGQLGNSLHLLIRGNSSVSLDNSPLIVLNGHPLNRFPTSASSASVGFGTRKELDPLRLLNERDITSVRVLKDVSAASIYGSRGANGVILIETDQEVLEKRFDYFSSISFSSTAKRFDLLEREEFLQVFGSFGGNVDFADYGNSIDWQREIFRSAFSHNQHFSFASPYKNGYLSGSLGYESVEGVVNQTKSNLLTGALNNSHSLLDGRLKIVSQMVVSSLKDGNPPISSNAGARGDLLSSAYVANPTWSPSPDSLQIGGGLINPNNLQANYRDDTQGDRVIFNFRPSLSLTKTTTLDFMWGLDWSRSDRSTAIASKSNNLTRGVPGNGRGALNDIDFNDRLIELKLKDSRTIGESKIDFFVAYSDQELERTTRDVEAWGFANTDPDQMISELRTYSDQLEGVISEPYQQYGISDNLRNASATTGFFANYLSPFTTEFLDPQATANIESVFGNVQEASTRLKSYSSQFTYSNRGKYFATISSRIDNTNIYPESQVSGAISVGWILSKEAFFSKKLSHFKLKTGYGEAGNLGFGLILPFNVNGDITKFYPNSFVATDGSISVPSALTLVTPTNSLKPERTREYNVGLEFAIDAMGLTGEVNAYRRSTSDLIVVSSNQFFRPFPTNVSGNVVNRGLEIDLSHQYASGKFSLLTRANFAWNRNRISDFDGSINYGPLFGPGLTSTFVQQVVSEEELFSYNLREFAGFDEAGLPTFGGVDAGKSSVSNAFGGMDFELQYNKWSLEIGLYGQFGHYLYNNTANAHFIVGAIANARNVPRSVVESGESAFATTAPSTRFLENGNFVRCRAITFGFRPKMKLNSFFDQFQAFLTLQNPFVLTGYTGLDPEVNIQTFGVDYLAFPMHRTVTLGISTSF